MVVAYFFKLYERQHCKYVETIVGGAWKLVYSTESLSLVKFRRKVRVNFMRAIKSKGYDPIATGPLSRRPCSHKAFLLLQAVLLN